MQFNKSFLVVSAFVLLAAAIFGVAWFTGAFEEAPKPAEGEAQSLSGTAGSQASKSDVASSMKSLNKGFSGKETPIIVQAAPVVRGELVQRVASQGRVHAYQNVEVQVEVGGRLLELLVQDGDTVKKGQVLARIDDREYGLALQEAEAGLLKAKAEYIVESGTLEEEDASGTDSTSDRQRLRKDLDDKYAKGLIAKEDYHAAVLELDLQEIRSGNLREKIVAARTLGASEVARSRAELDLEKTVIRAPFDGMIFDVTVTEGQLLAPNTRLMRLVNLKELVVKAQVLESAIGEVRKGRKAEITFPALLDKSAMIGDVQAVSPFVNAEEKTVEAIVRFKSDDDRIRPGMFAEISIDARVYDDRLMVPKTAILPREDRFVIFVVGPESRAQWVYVKTGVTNDEFVEITDGKLEPGDMVLTDNHFTMGHDTLVKVTKKK